MTTYIELNGIEMWNRIANVQCPYCGEREHSHCPVRFCDSCTQHWLAGDVKELEEFGPSYQQCPTCDEWEQAGYPQECVALVKLVRCVDCHAPTTGSVGPATGFVKCICQPCRSYSVAKIDSATRAFAWAARIAA